MSILLATMAGFGSLIDIFDIMNESNKTNPEEPNDKSWYDIVKIYCHALYSPGFMSGTNYRAFGLFALSLVFLASNFLMLLGVDTGVPSLLLQWLVLNMAKLITDLGLFAWMVLWTIYFATMLEDAECNENG